VLTLRKRSLWTFVSAALLLAMTSCGESTPTPDWSTYSPECTVQELIDAINDANNDGFPSEIQLPANCTYTLTSVDNTQSLNYMDMHNGLPVIASEITIRGNNSVIDIQPAAGESLFGHFYVAPEHDLNLYDLTLSNGVRPAGGAVVNHSGDFFAFHVKFLNNAAYPGGLDNLARGGAIYSFFGRVRILAGSLFQGNLAGETLSTGANLGGAVFAINANLLINDSYFVENYAAGHGGAVYNQRSAADLEGGLVAIQDTEFTHNQALQDGGAIYLMEEDDGAIIVTSSFFENEADRYGGAIYTQDSDLKADHSEFYGNQAESGGAVYTRRSAEGVPSSFVSDHSSYTTNSAAVSGGAICSENSDVEMEDTMVAFNQAGSCGGIQLGGYPGLDVAAGALEGSLWLNSESELDQCTIASNQAFSGMGGGVCHQMGELSIQDSSLENNQTPSYGGGLISFSELEVTASGFTGNQAYRGGGLALGFPRDETSSFNPDLTYFAFSSIIRGSAIMENESVGAGGGIWASHGGSVFIEKSTIGSNTAAFEGGGIYQDQGDLGIRNSTLAENSAWRGGGLYSEGTGSTNPVLHLTHVTVAYNTATDDGSDLRSGGGGLNINGRVYIDSSLVALNSNNDCDLNQGMQGLGDYADCGQTYCPQTLLSFDSDDTCGFDNPPEPSPQLDSFTGVYVPILAGSPLIDSCACYAPDDQLGHPRTASCEPGAIEYVGTSPPPPPPEAPEPSDGEAECDPFAGLEVAVVTLGMDPESLSLPVYLSFPDTVPGIPEDGIIPYRGVLGEFPSYLVNQQGFDGRLYFMFSLPRSAIGSALELRIYKDGCDDPVFVNPRLIVPEFPPEEEQLQCRAGLGEKACKEAGGTWYEGGAAEPTCKCP
jgi:predicted outer membrane repeat protein